MKYNLFLILFLTGFGADAQGTVKDIQLTDVVSGQAVSWSDYKTQGIVLIFTSNRCPFDGYYLDRLRSLSSTYSGRIPFILVNAYPEPEEDAAQMKASADSWGLSLPYLADKDQVAMTTLGVRKTPEAIILKPVGNAFSVVYHGGIDDNPQSPAAVTQPYLRQAIENFLNGKVVAENPARSAGCSIRKKSP